MIPVLVLILITYYFQSSGTATTQFNAKPSTPSPAVEGQNLTLEWNYTLDGTFGLAQFFNSTGFGTESIGKTFSPGKMTVESKYQERFRGQATNTRAELTILTVQRSDQGTYTVKVVPTGSSFLLHDVEVTVQYPPNIISISLNKTVAEGDVVLLNCTADGNPEPSITWTRLSSNSIVSMPMTIAGKQDEGGYRCTADNGIGSSTATDVFITVQFYRPINTDLSTNLTSNTVQLNETFNLLCHADANPAAKYRLYRDQSSLTNIARGQSNGTYLASVGIRVRQVTYKCVPFNTFGDGPAKTINVTVYYNPTIVSLVANTTENKNCSDFLSVNFTCEASEANPPVENYQLLKNQEILATSSKWTWVKNISEKGDHMYSCIALHPLGNVTSFDVRVTFNVPVQISVDIISGWETLTQGGNLALSCNASGYPEPTVTWSKLNADELITSSLWLNFTNINKEATGEYVCDSNNTCGKKRSSVRTIDVQYKPENVSLTTSSLKVCIGKTVILMCSAGDSNPAVENFKLYKYGIGLVDMVRANVGIFNQTLYSQGQHNYSCEARNSIGNASSGNTILEVEVPASVIVMNRTMVVNEGDNVTLHCISSGFPRPNVSWVNASNYIVETGSILKLTNIGRHIRGFNCSASNACGNESRKVDIDVQYKPENVSLSTSSYKVCTGQTVILMCSSGDSNPAVEHFKLYKNGVALINMVGAKKGVFKQTLYSRGQHTYSCEASNSVGNASSSNTILEVEFPASVTVENRTVVVKEGDNVTLHCISSGLPRPNVSWVNASSYIIETGSVLNLTNISRHIPAFNCSASNACGNDSRKVDFDVQYAAEAKIRGENYSVSEGGIKLFSCLVDGNPEPNITWYKGSKASGTVISIAKQLQARESGCYTCSASNSLGTPVTITQCLIMVASPLSTRTLQTSPTERMEIIKQITLTITNMDCNDFSEEEFRKEVEETLQPFELNSVEMETRCGSVVVYLTLRFLRSVRGNEAISALVDAARQNKFGNFIVDPNSIKELLSPEMRSTIPTTTRTAKEDKSPKNDITSWAVIGGLVVIIILLIAGLVWQCRRRGIAGRERPYQVPGDFNAEFYENYTMDEINPDGVQPSNSNQQIKKPTEPAYTPCQTGTQYDIPPSRSKSCPQDDEYAQVDIRTISWEVARHDVKVGETIGEGAFGQVAKGTADNLPFHSRKSIVAVKMLKDDATESDKRDLKSELELMKTLKPHPHVIELLGCVTETEPLLVLIEYVPYGDLLGYLRKSRGLNDTYYNNPDIKPQTNLTPQQLIKFSWQIADGMSYLSSRKIIHRDLAARNVLVGETETCKVTDFGMARSVENIYERKTNGRLPVKWTAYESLLYGEYTTESDVWSYGVVLYEIFTVGGSPYPQMDGQSIFSLLRRGSRMPKPQHVDNELYQIMMNCWKREPNARPSFAHLTQQLKKLENQHKRLLNMHIYENTLYENLEDLNA